MRDRICLINVHLCGFVILLFLGTLPSAVTGTEAITQKKPMEVSGSDVSVVETITHRGGKSEGWSSPLILKDVNVGEVSVQRASSGHFVLEWITREVTGEKEELVPGLAGKSSFPTAYSLSQNYPNPFNPSTTIAFELPGSAGEKQHVNLIIYDMRGRRVRTLIDSEYKPGNYSVNWNGWDDRGRKVSSGIYLYTLRAGGKRFTRKMTVLK